MAMAGQGLHAAPPPRPPSHNYFNHQNPGNQLYVGNVRTTLPLNGSVPLAHLRHSCRTKLAGRTSRTCSALLGTSYALTSTLARTVVRRARARSSSRPQRMPSKQSVRLRPDLLITQLNCVPLPQACTTVSSGTAAYSKCARIATPG